MSKLTWITGKELEREIKNNGNQLLCQKKKYYNYIAVERK